MKSFKQFLQEMADETGKLDNKQFSKEYDWNRFYKGTDKPILILDKIGSEHYKLYRVHSSFYLTDEDNNYKGQIELNIADNIGVIKSSNSQIAHGFYNIMFTSILGSGVVSELRSDTELSSNAIDAYIRLKTNPKLLVRILTSNDYIELNKQELLSNYNYRVSVVEKHGKGSIKEHYNNYLERISEIDENGVPSAFNRAYFEHSSGLNNYLFGEDFINEVEIHPTLNDKIWDKNELKPEVKTTLKDIADNFIKFLGVDAKNVKDIIFTGSNANFNYHSGSDIDIHIELDVSNIKCINIDDFLKTKKTLWNEQHDITVYGYDVELYAEPSNEHPVSNAGVYSIKQDKWLVEPIKIDTSNIDEKAIKNKANTIKHQIDTIIKHKVDDINSIKKLKESIRTMRAEGINTGGEYSTENLAFKVLRDEGYLDKFSKYAEDIIDNNLSLK